MSNKPNFLVIDEDIHPAGVDLLRSVGNVTIRSAALPEDEMIKSLPGVFGILVRKGKITERLVAHAPDLRIVARHGVGVDSVDRPALAKRNIVLTITRTANANAVAEFAMAMMLGLSRHVPRASEDVKAGLWTPNNYIGPEIGGKVLGIVGFGQIGRNLTRFARGFGMDVRVADPYVSAETAAAQGVTKVDYDSLLKDVDFLSYHVRLTDETRGIFGDRELEIVKPGVRIINVSRGGICSEAALVKGLDSGRIAGVALDTFEQEPVPVDHPLMAYPNALLSPHVAGQSEEAMRNMSFAAAQSIVDCFKGREPQDVYPPDD